MQHDNLGASIYAQFMAEQLPHLVLTIEHKQPVEIGAFVSSFTSLASQYEKFIKANYPELSPDATLFVRDVREGSIEADLLPWALFGASAVVNSMDQVLIVRKFVETYGKNLRAYFSPNAAKPDASKSDLKDFMGSVEAIANDPNGKASLKAVSYEKGKEKVKASITFDTKQARTAAEQIEKHRRQIERVSSADNERVLMIFSQSNVKDTPVGKRTGEWVVINSISDRPLPLVYASELAEQRIKHEIREADDNVYKKGFVVDVNVEMRGDRAIAYRVTNLHQVIDLPDDE